MSASPKQAKTINDLIFFGKKGYDGALFGVEIETESKVPYFERDVCAGTVFDAKHDGSLRNFGIEYVTNGAYGKDVAKKNISTIIDRLLKIEGIDNGCPRAGTHVHSNVRDLTTSQVWTMACIYWAIEAPLTEWCGKSRVGNNFCLRLKDATRLVGMSVNAIRNEAIGKPQFDNLFATYRADSCKYSGLNLATVYKFGTLEFRSLDSVLDDKRIGNWIDQIDHMRSLAIEFGNPHAFFDWVDKNDDKKTLYKKLLTPYFFDVINVDKAFEYFYTELTYPLSIAYACGDWAKLEQGIAERFDAKKKKYNDVPKPAWRLNDGGAVVENDIAAVLNDFQPIQADVPIPADFEDDEPEDEIE